MKSVKRTAEKIRGSGCFIQPSASRTSNPLAPFPSSKLLGYCHSSALRTDKSTFRAKRARTVGSVPGCCQSFGRLFSKSAAHLARIPGRGDSVLISQLYLGSIPVLALPGRAIGVFHSIDQD